MDVNATYCWMPFKTHVSINVDMYFLRAFFETFFSLSLSVFVPFKLTCRWERERERGLIRIQCLQKSFQNTLNKLLFGCIRLHGKMKWTTTLVSTSIRFALRNFIVIRMRSSPKCIRQTCFKAIIIKSICEICKRLYPKCILTPLCPEFGSCFGFFILQLGWICLKWCWYYVGLGKFFFHVYSSHFYFFSRMLVIQYFFHRFHLTGR